MSDHNIVNLSSGFLTTTVAKDRQQRPKIYVEAFDGLGTVFVRMTADEARSFIEDLQRAAEELEKK